MPHYSAISNTRLLTCDDRLIEIFEEVIEHFDNSILCGHRGQEEQDKAFRLGHSKVQFPNGKHNSLPSKAVDAAPYPIDWNDRERMTYFAGFVMAVAAMKGIKLRWGGDWDRDTEVSDNGFDDLVHFELAE